MNKSIIFYLGLFLALSNIVMANPDWIFKDSASTYDGAFLNVYRKDNNIKNMYYFELVTQDYAPYVIPGITLPKNGFDINDLTTYVQNEPNLFNDPVLKKDMEEMLDFGWESKFDAKPFLTELIRVLNAYMLSRDIAPQY